MASFVLASDNQQVKAQNQNKRIAHFRNGNIYNNYYRRLMNMVKKEI